MIVTTGENLNGRAYEIIDIVSGSTVQSKHIGKDSLAGFKSMVGGEITSYTELLADARSIAYSRMIGNAEKIGADAVICFRFSSSSIMDGASELLAYGTAVKFL